MPVGGAWAHQQQGWGGKGRDAQYSALPLPLHKQMVVGTGMVVGGGGGGGWVARMQPWAAHRPTRYHHTPMLPLHERSLSYPLPPFLPATP